MYNQGAFQDGSQRSVIRELYEYGRRRKAELGSDAICDFSLGNPSVPPPQAVRQAFLSILEQDNDMEVHGYTSSAGSDELRTALAASLTRRFGMAILPGELFITCGAASALCACFAALTLSTETEFIAIAPFFPEYRCFSACAGGKLRVVPADEEHFQIDFSALEAAIGPQTQGVILNSPNNPSGVVYTTATLEQLAALLRRKGEAFGHPIYLISDEPYRELCYDGVEVPFLPAIYENTIVCYSFSKSLSLPGDRLGYVLVPSCVTDTAGVYTAIAGAARKLGHVCAPSTVQKAVARCVDAMPDLTVYTRNRALLLEAMPRMGYRIAKPDGAFYLFFRAPHGDGNSFSEAAKEKGVILVPCASFGCPDYLRLAYCVPTETVERALPILRTLI